MAESNKPSKGSHHNGEHTDNDGLLDGHTESMRHLRHYSSHKRNDILSVSRLQRHGNSHGHAPFRPLPAPTGTPPYHLDIATVLPPDKLEAMKKGFAFHVAGDTGGVKKPDPQKLVSMRMVQDLTEGNPLPAFFYHLGDVVYFFGESEKYYDQFYEPYSHYDAPIFAIPGNHDGDLSHQMEEDNVPSLQGFVNNFCQRIPHHTREALDETRTGMTQPNVYWTLKTPLVTIIGLYTNVPEGGRLDDDQIIWLEEELSSMKGQGPLIVAMHHPIYSLESLHSGSIYMGNILDKAIERSGRVPDMVLAGHVHNYQRFTRQYKVDGTNYEIPYIVAGAGGYFNLHHLPTDIKEARLPYTDNQVKDVQLEKYCDDQYGFLRLEITPQKKLKGTYITVPGFQDPNVDEVKSKTFDNFEVDLDRHKIAEKTLAGAR
jgi:acid phosphatase type 7